MANILVTGATGTVGRQVAAQLAAAGANVRAGVREPSKAADLSEAGVEVVTFDFTDAGTVKAALEGIDHVFLLTPFVEDPAPLVQAVVDAAKDAGVRHIVRMSAIGADASSELALAREHARNEQIVKDSGLGWTILQPGFFMDNILNYGRDSILGEGKFYGSAGQGKTTYISSADIAAVAAKILQDPTGHAGKTHVLTGSEPLTGDDIAAATTKLVGKDVAYVDLTPEQQAQGMQSWGAPGWMVDGLVGLEAVKRNGWVEAVSPAVADILGRSPETLAAFLERNRDRLAA